MTEYERAILRALLEDYQAYFHLPSQHWLECIISNAPNLFEAQLIERTSHTSDSVRLTRLGVATAVMLESAGCPREPS